MNPKMTRHDYEPGEAANAMHTEPLCAVCGLAKSVAVHGE